MAEYVPTTHQAHEMTHRLLWVVFSSGTSIHTKYTRIRGFSDRLLLAEFIVYYNDRPHQGAELAGLSPNEYARQLGCSTC